MYNRLCVTSHRSTDTNDKPIGLGRWGERVANCPTLMPFPRGGRIFDFFVLLDMRLVLVLLLQLPSV